MKDRELTFIVKTEYNQSSAPSTSDNDNSVRTARNENDGNDGSTGNHSSTIAIDDDNAHPVAHPYLASDTDFIPPPGSTPLSRDREEKIALTTPMLSPLSSTSLSLTSPNPNANPNPNRSKSGNIAVSSFEQFKISKSLGAHPGQPSPSTARGRMLFAHELGLGLRKSSGGGSAGIILNETMRNAVGYRKSFLSTHPGGIKGALPGHRSILGALLGVEESKDNNDNDGNITRSSTNGTSNGNGSDKSSSTNGNGNTTSSKQIPTPFLDSSENANLQVLVSSLMDQNSAMEDMLYSTLNKVRTRVEPLLFVSVCFFLSCFVYHDCTNIILLSLLTTLHSTL